MTQTESAHSGPAPGTCPVHNFNYTEHKPAGTWFARYDELRAEGPVYWNEFGPGFWTMTNHESILEVLQNPEAFSNGVVTPLDPDPQYKWIPEMLDGDEHLQWRQQLGPMFSPKSVARLEDKIRQRAGDLIDDIVAKGTGECELMAEFAQVFPTSIFLELIGLPVEELDQFMEWEHAILHTPGGTEDSQQIKLQAMHAVMGRFAGIIAERRAEPRDDIVSEALTFKVDGEPVSDNDLLSFCLLMFMAGLDTVSATLGWMFRHFATHPEDQRRLVDEPELIPTAIEELLRASAIVGSARKVMKDTEIQGCPLKAGDMVSIPMSAATRDEAVFDNAATVDIGRSPNNHIAFGAGPHRCLGSHLARRELRIAVEEWNKRIPEYRLVPGTQLIETGGMIGLTSLPLEWDRN